MPAFDDITHVIQLAIAPVFLLTAIIVGIIVVSLLPLLYAFLASKLRRRA